MIERIQYWRLKILLPRERRCLWSPLGERRRNSLRTSLEVSQFPSLRRSPFIQILGDGWSLPCQLMSLSRFFLHIPVPYFLPARLCHYVPSAFGDGSQSGLGLLYCVHQQEHFQFNYKIEMIVIFSLLLLYYLSVINIYIYIFFSIIFTSLKLQRSGRRDIRYDYPR